MSWGLKGMKQRLWLVGSRGSRDAERTLMRLRAGAWGARAQPGVRDVGGGDWALGQERLKQRPWGTKV